MRNIILFGTVSIIAVSCGGGGSSSSTDDGTNSTSQVETHLGEASYADGVYTITADGKTVNLKTDATINGAPSFLNAVYVDGAAGRAAGAGGANSDFVAAAWIGDDDIYMGYSGTKSEGFTGSGTVNFSGGAQIITPTSVQSTTITATANLDSGEFSGQNSSGTTTGNQISGTTSYNGSAGTLNGGVYGDGLEANGVFSGNAGNYAGTFTTTASN